MMRPDTKVEKVYLYPKPVDFRKIDRRPHRSGRTGYLSRCVRFGAFRVPQHLFGRVLLVTPIIPLVQINLRSK